MVRPAARADLRKDERLRARGVLVGLLIAHIGGAAVSIEKESVAVTYQPNCSANCFIIPP